ncbi:MAG: aminotransferase class I/II-fold pyridoxal phosphate-dependent enzyme [Hyphomicrobiaceae bacterium]|nr:aminotransferase class I/II-fold pyridoxal phosphate-dependent enzyme [Hyphomicrobiaceae bacterium]
MDVMREAAAREAAGQSVLHLEVGQPAAPLPETARKAAERALAKEADKLGYTEALGRPSLRARIARHYKERHGLDIAPERIVITTGSSAGFILSFLALCDAGARIALPAPGYPAYRNIVRALDMVPAEIALKAESRWVLSPEALLEEHSVKPLSALLVASPNNPTGTVMQPEAQKALARAAEDAGIAYISDEIYHGLVHEGAEESILAATDKAVVINSFSKYFCMTGWRIGWMVIPPELVRTVERLQQNLFICAPALSQIVAEAVFEDTPALEEIKAGYARNRARLLESLPKIGFRDILPADGAFYIYADVTPFSNDSRDFAATVLQETGVAITPGVDFDLERGHRYVRLSFAGAETTIAEAVSRLGDHLKG